MNSFLPNLFVLGAAKCGTTSLYFYLNQMPEVCMAGGKEPYFFEYYYDRGLEFYRKKYFSHWKGEKYIGEARHRNLFLPFIPEEIYEVNPSAKLVVIVRDPVERAYSHWWHYYSRRLEKLSFPEAVRKNHERIAAGIECKTRREYSRHFDPNETLYMNIGTYIDSGYYYEQILRYRKYFPSNQIKVLFFGDLCNNPQNLIAGLREFLGLPAKNKKEITQIASNSNMISFTNSRARKAIDLLGIRKVLPEKVFSALKGYYRHTFLKQPKIDKKTRGWLSEHYREHNRTLQEDLKADLSHWG